MENNHSPVPTIPVKSARNVIATAGPQTSPSKLCGAVGLDSKRLNDAHGRMPMSQLIALYETTATVTKDQAFGLHVGLQTSLRSFGVFGYVVMNSTTVGQAFERAVRYFPSWTDGAHFSWHQEGSACRMIWQYTKPFGVCRHDCEMTLLSAAKVSQMSGIRDWQPREVHFQHSQPRDTSEHRRLFRAPIYFRMQHNQLIFDRATVRAPLRNADPVLGDILTSHADHLLATSPSRFSFINCVEFAVRQSVRDGDIGLASLSRRLGISTRTLQRKLKDHGTSFTELLGHARRDLAEHGLRDTELSIGEISYGLGYSNTSEFHRAFKIWTGLAPKQYRLKNDPKGATGSAGSEIPEPRSDR